MDISPELEQNVFGFVSGLIGAVVGGLFTLYATRTELRANERAKDREAREGIRSMLDSMRVEMDALWSFHQKRIGETVEQLKEGEPLLFYYPLTQDYFTIYDSNAASIGRLPDAQIRTIIVRTYNKGKKIVDGFKYNNMLYREYSDMIIHDDNSAGDKARITAKHKELCDYAIVVKSDHYEMKTLVEEMLATLAER